MTSRSALRPGVTDPCQPVESLESRQLMSAALEGGVWNIRGDDNPSAPNDLIVVETLAGDAGTLRATINGVVAGEVAASLVSQISVDAGAGNDRVSLRLTGLAASTQVVVFGGSGNDRVTGSSHDEQMFGGSGNDRLDGAGGNDSLHGEDGEDHLLGGDGDDTLRGGEGNDVLAGGFGADLLDGGGGKDRLDGGDDSDVLLGDKGADTLAGGKGPDYLVGGKGRDRVQREVGVDLLNILPGDDPAQSKAVKGDRMIHDNVASPAPRQNTTEDLRQWVIDAAVKQWKWAFGQQVWSWNYIYARGGEVVVAKNATVGGGAVVGAPSPTPSPTPPPAQAPVDAVGGNAGEGSSGTNTQEQGVDEADLVETDGRYIYTLQQDALVIADAVPANNMSVVARHEIEGTPLGIYRHGDRVTILTGSQWYWFDPLPIDIGIPAVGAASMIAPPFPQTPPTITVTVLDVSNPAAPKVVEETKLDGSYDSSRMIGERLYVVVRNDAWFPEPLKIPVDGGEEDDGGDVTDPPGVSDPGDPTITNDMRILPPIGGGGEVTHVYESEAAYRARLEAMPLEELLPGYESTAGGQSETGLLIHGTDAYARTLDDDTIGQNLTTLALLNVADEEGGPTATTTVAGFGGTAYASADNFYLASPSWDDDGEQTRIFKFALGDDDVPLLATGEVNGSVLNQFAMDEDGEYFRIATNHWDGEAGPASSLFVLDQSGDDLAVVGSVNNLARGERLQAARFVDDRAYLVTFRQVDPLFVIDLSSPTKPRVAGELKVPGFSTYLHPISGDLLLGFGRDVDEDTQEDKGLQLSLFDVSNPAAPKRLATYKLSEEWGSSEAAFDHHAFAYFSDQNIVAVPVDEYDRTTFESTQTLKVLSIDLTAGTFNLLGTVDPPSGVHRSVRIGDVLYAVGDEHIRSVELQDPDTVLDTLDTSD